VHIDAADGSEDVAEAVRATAADTEDAVRDMEEDEAMTRQALDLGAIGGKPAAELTQARASARHEGRRRPSRRSRQAPTPRSRAQAPR
jgi:hypothetical protein